MHARRVLQCRACDACLCCVPRGAVQSGIALKSVWGNICGLVVAGGESDEFRFAASLSAVVWRVEELDRNFFSSGTN